MDQLIQTLSGLGKWIIPVIVLAAIVLPQGIRILRDPAPELFFLGFGDSALNFELGVWTSEMTAKPRRFRSELYYAMEKKLQAAGPNTASAAAKG